LSGHSHFKHIFKTSYRRITYEEDVLKLYLGYYKIQLIAFIKS